MRALHFIFRIMMTGLTTYVLMIIVPIALVWWISNEPVAIASLFVIVAIGVVQFFRTMTAF